MAVLGDSVYEPIISNRNGLRGGDIATKYKMLKQGSKYNGNDKGGEEYKKECFSLDLKWLVEYFLQDMKFLDDAEKHFKHKKILQECKYKRIQTKLSFLQEVTRIQSQQSAWSNVVLQSLFEERLLSYIPDIDNYLTFSNAWTLEPKSISGFKQPKNEDEWFSDLLDKKPMKGIFGSNYNYQDLWSPLAKSMKSNYFDNPSIVSIVDEGEVTLEKDFGFHSGKIHYIPWVIFMLKNITRSFNNNIQIQFSNNIIAKYRDAEYGSGWVFTRGTNPSSEFNTNWEEFKIDGLIDFNLRKENR